MNFRDYDQIKQKLDEVIAIAERFPESVRELVYQSLLDALLQKGNADQASSLAEQQTVAAGQQIDVTGLSIIDSKSASEFSSYLEQYEGIRLNDMEFCAVVARFFTQDISQERRLDSIDPELLMHAGMIADRPKHTTNHATTPNNAKNVGKYLEPKGKGVYGISQNGIRELNRKLNARSRLTTQKPLDEI